MSKTILYGVGSIGIDFAPGVITLWQTHEGERTSHYVEMPICAVEAIIAALRSAETQSRTASK